VGGAGPSGPAGPQGPTGPEGPGSQFNALLGDAGGQLQINNGGSLVNNASNCLVGQIMLLSFGIGPTMTGIVPADGRSLPIAGNTVLFSLIGTTYGGNDAGTTFNLPDLRALAPNGTQYGMCMNGVYP
jgi:hypothetical protein